MASIEYRKKSARVIAYIDNEKVCFPLGPIAKKTAQRFANNIDTLIHEHRCNLPVSREVSNWLCGLDDSLYELLVDRGFVEARVEAQKLDKFTDAYIEQRTDVTERRRGKLKNAKDRMIEFFGDIALSNVTPGLADEYARWLLEKLAPATAKKECEIAGQFFRHAYRKELVSRNPFDGISIGQATNVDRRIYIPTETVERVLKACPNWQWRTVVALARYGGLRCTSEVALLKWSDIHWDQERMSVTSPKTKRYGKASRIVPLFPELHQALDEAFTMCNEGEKWVVPMLSGQTDKNLGTTFKKIISRAGVDPWPKPFQNLRSSRQTDLEKEHPTYVVCEWLGNTPNIAHKHYLTVTDADFEKATNNGGQAGDKLGTQPPESIRNAVNSESAKPYLVRENEYFSEVVGMFEYALVAEEGLEPPTRGL